MAELGTAVDVKFPARAKGFNRFYKKSPVLAHFMALAGWYVSDENENDWIIYYRSRKNLFS